MNLYVDSSALIKRYITEPGSTEMDEMFGHAETVATSVVTRAEIAATFAKAVRKGAVSEKMALRQLNRFRDEWPSFVGLEVVEWVVTQAENLAWQYGLRGYDAIHLAAALTWGDAARDHVIMTTFDRALWQTAKRVGLDVFPPDLADFIRPTSRRN